MQVRKKKIIIYNLESPKEKKLNVALVYSETSFIPLIEKKIVFYFILYHILYNYS